MLNATQNAVAEHSRILSNPLDLHDMLQPPSHWNPTPKVLSDETQIANCILILYLVLPQSSELRLNSFFTNFAHSEHVKS